MYLNYADPENIEDVVKAIKEDDLVTLRFCLRDGMDPDSRDRHGLGLLHIAAMEGKTEAVEALLQSGADPDLLVATTKHTPLFYAAREKSAAIITLLVDYHAELEARDSFGYTPLLMAAAHGCHEAVKALIEEGADVLAANNDGQTARDVSWRRYEGPRQPDDWITYETLRQAEAALSGETQRREHVERDIASLKRHNPGKFRLRF